MLLNDQFVVSAYLFALIMSVFVLIQSILVGITRNDSIRKVLYLFIFEMKEYWLVVILLIIGLLRATYIFLIVISSRSSTGEISKILYDKTWLKFDILDLERAIEMEEQVAKEKDRRLDKAIKKHNRIAAIEFRFFCDGKEHKRKQYFWLLSTKKLYDIVNENKIDINVNNTNNGIAFVSIR